MKCGEAQTFLSQIDGRAGSQTIAPIASNDLDFLTVNGYVLRTNKEDYDSWVESVAKLSEMTLQMDTEQAEEEKAAATLQSDAQKEHSILFHLEGKEKKDQLRERARSEAALVSKEQSDLSAIEDNVNELIQKKSMIDRMVPYSGEYMSLTDIGSLTLRDLVVREYRVAEEEFPDFLTEIKATYSELRSIADRAASYVTLLKPRIPKMDEELDDRGLTVSGASSLLWSTAIGLGKLQGETNQLAERFVQALGVLQNFDSSTPSKLMAAEIMTAVSNQDLQSLKSALTSLEKQLRNQGVPKELSAGVAATIMAGRRYDGTYPVDGFVRFKGLTQSYEASAILSVMNLPYEDLSAKFQSIRSMFASWGYAASEDIEVASAFLAIGELGANEVEEKLKYIVDQLWNYLQFPYVAAAILASIPVFEAHEVLDLMEKAVTLLSGYATGLQRSELVALAVRMIHGVRNELVKEIDPTARISSTPVQFTYSLHPGFFAWYWPVIVAHSSYHSTFSAMGGFHPAHSHGVGGFAG
jgi:hypothetical protein